MRPWLRAAVRVASRSAGVTRVAGAGTARTRAAVAGATRTRAVVAGLGFGFAARTRTSGSFTCAPAMPMQQISASIPRGTHAQNTRLQIALQIPTDITPAYTCCACVAKRPVHGGRAVAAHHGMEGSRACNPLLIAGPERGDGEDQQRPKVRREAERGTGMAHVARRKRWPQHNSSARPGQPQRARAAAAPAAATKSWRDES